MQTPRVSVVIIFLNEERFIREAVDSVFAQTFRSWEIILADDGSCDASTTFARDLAKSHPGRVRYLEHPDHANRGMSATRNLALSQAEGEFVAFLDADDVWLPRKLEEQVAIMGDHPEAGMVYGRTRIWHSWCQTARERDFHYDLGATPDRVHAAPELLGVLLENRAQTPTTCNAMVRTSVARQVGGFDDSFRGMFEDQVFFAKILLRWPAFLSDREWALYRQHPGSHSAQVSELAMLRARIRFLSALLDHAGREPGIAPGARTTIRSHLLDARRSLVSGVARAVRRRTMAAFGYR